MTISSFEDPCVRFELSSVEEIANLWPRSRDMATVSFFMFFPLMRPFEKRGVKVGALPKHLGP